MPKSYWIALLIAFAFGHSELYASKRTATVSGNWNSTTTWGGLSVPGCVDTIVIPAGRIVTVTVSVNLTGCPPVAIIIGGALNFQSGKKLDLPSGSYVYLQTGGGLQSGGGGGSSNTIAIGGITYWAAGCSGSPPPDCGSITGPDILCQNCALPIELVNFSAALLNGVVLIKWQTASESENDFFSIQRSKDGFVWEEIAVVDGAGNSSALLDYMEEDRSPYLGISYYRLKQVDMNGDFTYSPVSMVSNGSFYSDQQLLILSTSSATQHNVVVYFAEPVEGDIQVFIAGLNGTVLYNETLTVTSEKWIVFTLDKSLAAGVYVVKANREIERAFFQ